MEDERTGSLPGLISQKVLEGSGARDSRSASKLLRLWFLLLLLLDFAFDGRRQWRLALPPFTIPVSITVSSCCSEKIRENKRENLFSRVFTCVFSVLWDPMHGKSQVEESSNMKLTY